MCVVTRSQMYLFLLGIWHLLYCRPSPEDLRADQSRQEPSLSAWLTVTLPIGRDRHELYSLIGSAGCLVLYKLGQPGNLQGTDCEIQAYPTRLGSNHPVHHGRLLHQLGKSSRHGGG